MQVNPYQVATPLLSVNRCGSDMTGGDRCQLYRPSERVRLKDGMRTHKRSSGLDIVALTLSIVLAGAVIVVDDAVFGAGLAVASAPTKLYADVDQRGPRGGQGPRGRQGSPGSRGEATVQVVREAREPTIPEWITAGGTVLAFGGVFAGVATLFANKKIARERVTYESIVRLWDQDLLESKAVMSSFLRGGLRPSNIGPAIWEGMSRDEQAATASGLWTHLNESSSLDDRRTVYEILAYPNMLERLASMYNDGLLDQKITKAMVEWEAKSFWEVARWWIAEIWSTEPDTYEEIWLLLGKPNEPPRPNPHEG
jgi:hypothetical protein